MLRRYLKYQKTVIALSRKVVSTLVYPVILIALSAVLIAILMTSSSRASRSSSRTSRRTFPC